MQINVITLVRNLEMAVGPVEFHEPVKLPVPCPRLSFGVIVAGHAGD